MVSFCVDPLPTPPLPPFLQSMSKGSSLPFYDPPLLVEEKEIKDNMKIIRLQQIGNKKEYIVRFEVSILLLPYSAVHITVDSL